MTTPVILFWEPGSCGDFVQSLLLSDYNNVSGVVKEFELDATGRTIPVIDPVFLDSYTHVDDQWYLKSWSPEEIESLSNSLKYLSTQYFIIPTHRLDQVELLKQHLSNCVTIGITYNDNLFPLVLKNWCKKVAPVDTALALVYNKPMHTLFKEKQVFGEFVLLEQLKHGYSLKTRVQNTFDLAINLDDIYNNDLTQLQSIIVVTTDIVDYYRAWLSKQNILHQFWYHAHVGIQTALGYNSKSKNLLTHDVDLDTFDNIFLKQYILSQGISIKVPKFKKLSEANIFFKQYIQ